MRERWRVVDIHRAVLLNYSKAAGVLYKGQFGLYCTGLQTDPPTTAPISLSFLLFIASVLILSLTLCLCLSLTFTLQLAHSQKLGTGISCNCYERERVREPMHTAEQTSSLFSHDRLVHAFVMSSRSRFSFYFHSPLSLTYLSLFYISLLSRSRIDVSFSI